MAGPVLSLIAFFLLPLGRGCAAHHAIQWLFASGGLWLLGVELEVSGRERVPEGGYVVVANHRSNIDTPLLMSALPALRFIAKSELVFMLPISFGMWVMGHIFVKRSKRSSGRAAIKAAAKRVAAGTPVIFFPEGTRARDGVSLPWRPGAMALAGRAKVPLLPVVIHGAAALWSASASLPGPGRIHIEILDPVHLPQGDLKAQRRIFGEVRDSVVARVG